MNDPMNDDTNTNDARREGARDALDAEARGPVTSSDDARVTAYALDELDIGERAAVEAFLATSAEGRAEVDAIRAAGDMLRDELGKEPRLALRPEQRARVDSALHADAARATDGSRESRGAGRLGPVLRIALPLLAATVLVALLLHTESFGPDAESPSRTMATREIARGDGAGSAVPETIEDMSRGPSHSQPAQPGMPRSKGEADAALAVNATSGVSPELNEEMKRALMALGYIGDVAGADESRALRVRSEDFHFPSRDWPMPPSDAPSHESYAPVHENEFRVLGSDPLMALSTFGIDVDAASYANMRRFLTRNQAPPPDAIRLEELVNAFRYDDPGPDAESEHPFAVTVTAAHAPWRPENRLVRVALKAMDIEHQLGQRRANNLVFLVDVSGSMNSADKLPLLKASLRMLLHELDEGDRVSLVSYANGTRVVLPSTPCTDKTVIEAALDGLTAAGSTHGSAGIQEAYRVASESRIAGGNNRVILASDGDFNVGITDQAELQRFIEGHAKSGIFLTVLGFGTGNLKDDTAEMLARRGNGNYAYIDTLNEAHRVLVEQMGGTLVTVAKDVKLQVEFNPARVRAYRLIGYENRILAAQDFRDDEKDAGELGSGHSVVALYEVVPVGAALPDGVALRYRQVDAVDPSTLVDSPELLTVALRYKQPDGETAREFDVPFVDPGRTFAEASDDFRFSAAVASFGMILRRSEHRGDTDLQRVLHWADGAKGRDEGGYRSEFVRLVRTAQGIEALR